MKKSLVLSYVFLIFLCELSSVKSQSLVTNGDFESGSSGQVNSWLTEAWKYKENIFSWEDSTGIDSSHCISISVDSITPNDARFFQNVDSLEPNSWCTLSGWIKGENVKGNAGSNLCLLGGWNRTIDLTGTFDWTEVSLVFQADSQGKASIACRLGFWGNTSSGKVWFDNISIKTRHSLESKYFTLLLEESDLTAISEENFERWLNHLDSAYLAYYNLTGFYPYGGDKIAIKSVDAYPGGWAVAGNPIKWHQIYVYAELKRINDFDDWSFGILHEIGHDFDDNGWNFEAEFFANFKMFYVLDTLNARVKQAGNFYIGSETAQHYKSRYDFEKDEFIRTGDLKGYTGCLMHRFIQIQQIIGWEPFIKTFHYLYSLDDALVPGNRLDKYYLFLSILSEYSGINVSKLIPQDDMNEFIAYIGEGRVNQIPAITIWNDTILSIKDTLFISPIYTDDGFPSDSLTYLWNILENPEKIWISDSTSSEVYVKFYIPGNYQLELSVSDSQSMASDTLDITVSPLVNSINQHKNKRNELLVYPNPTNTIINIDLTLLEGSNIHMYLFNLNGQEIKSSFKGYLSKRTHKKIWNSLNVTPLSQGIYILVIKTDNTILTKKIVINAN